MFAAGTVTFTSSDGQEVAIPEVVLEFIIPLEFVNSGAAFTTKLTASNIKIFLTTLTSLKQAQDARLKGERPRDLLLRTNLSEVTKDNVCALLLEADRHNIELLFRALARKAAMLTYEGVLSIENLIEGLKYQGDNDTVLDRAALGAVYNMYVLEYHEKGPYQTRQTLREACIQNRAQFGTSIQDRSAKRPRRTAKLFFHRYQ